jgi:hypothetical protein
VHSYTLCDKLDNTFCRQKNLKSHRVFLPINMYQINKGSYMKQYGLGLHISFLYVLTPPFEASKTEKANFISTALQSLMGQGLLIIEVSRSRSVGHNTLGSIPLEG